MNEEFLSLLKQIQEVRCASQFSEFCDIAVRSELLDEEDNVEYLVAELISSVPDPDLRSLLLALFYNHFHIGTPMGFLAVENYRYQVARKERGWLSYEEYCEMKRKENE